MTDLMHVAAELQSLLQSQKWKFCFIGGLAVQQWGEPRITRDVDITLLTGFGNEEKYVDELLKHYRGRREDARQFALDNRVLLLKTSEGIGLDIALGGIPFEESAVKRAKEIEVLPGIRLRMCTAEDLIVFKAFAGREIDWFDVRGIVTRQVSNHLNWKYIHEQLAPLVELKDEPEILTKLEKIRSES